MKRFSFPLWLSLGDCVPDTRGRLLRRPVLSFLIVLLATLSVQLRRADAFSLTFPTSRITERGPGQTCPFSSARALLKATPDASPNSSRAEQREAAIEIEPNNVWEQVALSFVNLEEDPSQIKDFVQYVSLLRVGLPSLVLAASAKLLYPMTSIMIADWISDSGVFAVVRETINSFDAFFS